MEFELPGDCPSGNECPVHFRLDREVKDESWMMYQAVTYVGNYCVFTGDNNKYINNPLLLLEAVLNDKAPDDLFTTKLYEVGFEGTLYDLIVTDGDLKPIRKTECGDFLTAETQHHAMVGDAYSM